MLHAGHTVWGLGVTSTSARKVIQDPEESMQH